MSIADKAKNAALETEGQVKQTVGRAADDRSLEAEGTGDKAAGHLKQAGEQVKDALGS